MEIIAISINIIIMPTLYIYQKATPSSYSHNTPKYQYRFCTNEYKCKHKCSSHDIRDDFANTLDLYDYYRVGRYNTQTYYRSHWYLLSDDQLKTILSQTSKN
jgi:hypothetical protein